MAVGVEGFDAVVGEVLVERDAKAKGTPKLKGRQISWRESAWWMRILAAKCSR